MGRLDAPVPELGAQPTRVRWRIIGLLMGFAAINHFNRISMPVAGLGIMRDYAIPAEQMGWVYFAFLLAYTCCMTPGGWLIDRVGPRGALAIMGFGSATFVALTGLAGTALIGAASIWGALLIVRFFAGIFSAPIHPGAARMVSFWAPFPALGAANGLVNGAAVLGIAATYPMFGGLNDRIGWQWSFVVAGIGTALWTALWLLHAADHPRQHPSVNEAECALIEGTAPLEPVVGQPPGTFKLLFANRSLLLITIAYAAVGYFEFLFFYWMEHYFNEILKLDKDTARIYSTVASLAMAIGMFAGGWIADWSQVRFGRRLGRALVPVAGMLTSAVLLGLGVSTIEPLLVITCFALSMAAIGTTEGPYWTTAVELGGRRGGTSAAIFNTGGNIGGLFAPVVTPYIGKYLHWQGGVAVAGLFCVLGAALWLGIDPAERTPDDPAA